jgi:hypothetical protein
MTTCAATLKKGLIAKEAGLSENIEIADDTHLANVEMSFEANRLDRLATWTTKRFGHGPSNLDAMSFRQTMITGDGNAFGQIDVDGEIGHGRPWQE